MSTVHVNGNKVTTSNVDEAKSILSNLFPTQVGFVEDGGKVAFAQNMSVQEAKKILNPKVVTKPKKKVKAEKVKPKKKAAKKKVKAKVKDKKKKKKSKK